MLSQIILYTIISVIAVSLISLIGIITLIVKQKNLKTFLIYLISFSAGALLGDSFFHLIPEISEGGLLLNSSAFILVGIALFFVLEKIIHWRHCHEDLMEKNHIHPFGYTNLMGDAMHNFLDGIIIAASYIVSIPVGIATSIAVILHEIPQEIGDFGVLIHAGFSKSKALALNFLSAILALFGAILTLSINKFSESAETILIPITIGSFIYIAGSDLIPQIHKHSEKLSKSLLQLVAFALGILIMYLLLFLE